MPKNSDQSFEEIESYSILPRHLHITSYGADFTVKTIVHSLISGDIYAPSFQRGFIWSPHQASLFIELLILGIPIPTVFLARESTGRMLIIDGQQRLLTLKYFYESAFGDTGKAFSLRGVSGELGGHTYETLPASAKYHLDNALIHSVIIQDFDQETIFEIFERLNTTGTPLTPHELRSALFDGELNRVLQELNHYQAWRDIYGEPSRRLKDEELILRFFALYLEGQHYRRPMSHFLTYFMQMNWNLENHNENDLVDIFTRTVDTIRQSLGKKAFKPSRVFNAAIFDAVMVGVARRLKHGSIKDFGGLRKKYEGLLKNPDFVTLISKSTDSNESVYSRIEIATRIFKSVR